MKETDWSRIEKAFERAVELEPERLEAFLEGEFPEEPELAREVRSLLREHASETATGKAPRLRVPEATPRRVGRYRLLEELGRGGSGRVFLAEPTEREFDRQVALKLLDRPVQDPFQRARFNQERAILGRLEHVGVARLYDGAVTEDGTAYLVMEHVDGTRIDRFADEQELSLEARVALFLEVCEAVAFAHRNLVVHRDLKPSNILVARDGRPKLLDFGVAKLLEEDSEAGLTRPANRGLTPRYASPEQLRGESVTVASDVYSLGALLYRLVTGGPHAPADLSSRLQEELAGTEPLAPNRAAPDAGIDRDLAAIVLRALRHETGERYRTVPELAADLERWRRGYPVEARAAGRSYRLRKFLWRNRAAMAAGVAGALLLGAWLTTRAADQREIRRQRDTARAVGDFMEELFEHSDPRISGIDVTAKQLLDQGKESPAFSRVETGGLRGALAYSIGRAYNQLGAHEDAQDLLAQAVAELRPVGSPLELGLALSELGWAQLENAHVSAAIDTGRQAVSELDASGTDVSDRLLARRRLALAESREGDYAAAEATLLDGLSLADRELEAGHSETRATQRVLCGVYGEQRRVDDVVACLGKLPLGWVDDEDPLALIDSLGLAGTAMLETGRIDEALELKAELLERTIELFGADHPETARQHVSHGIGLQRAGRLDEAEAALLTAIDIRRRHYVDGHPSISFDLTHLAWNYLDQGLPEKAEAAWLESIEGLRRTAPYYQPRSGPLLSLANLYMKQDRCPEALPLIEEARSLLDDAPPEHRGLAQASKLEAACGGGGSASPE